MYLKAEIYQGLKKYFLEGGKFKKTIKIGQIGSYASILGFIFIVFPLVNEEFSVFLAVLFIGFCCIIFLIEGLYYRIKFVFAERQSNYARAFIYLSTINTKIHNLFSYNKSVDDEVSQKEKLLVLQEVCDQLAEAFSIITNQSCSVCLKVLSKKTDKDKDIERPKVYTLRRDTKNPKRDYPSEKNIEHLINRNTDFKDIFHKLGAPDDCFFENELPFKKPYWNTSFASYSNNKYSYKGLPEEILKKSQRLKSWVLPYKSTIVVPIWKPSKEQEGNINISMLGYLCVDCNEMNVFDKEFDENIMKDIASCIYDLLKDYINHVIKTKNGKKK